MRIERKNVNGLSAMRETIPELVNLFDGWDKFNLIIETNYKDNMITIKVEEVANG